MFVNKLNYNPSGNLVSDEVVSLANGNKAYTLLHHNIITDTSPIQVWTGVGLTGTQITDFTTSIDDTKTWVTNITFGASVTDGTYYVTYYSQGDENDADDINALQNAITDMGSPEKVLVKYVHSGNPIIKPISVDITTGIFTAQDPLPISVGQTIGFTTNYLNGYPSALMSEWNGINTFRIYAIDSTTFYIQDNSSGSYVNHTSYSKTIDLTNIVFEYNEASASINISGIDMPRHFKIRLFSTSNRSGWRNTNISFNDSITGTTKSIDYGGTDGRQFLIYYKEYEYHYYPEMQTLVMLGGRNASQSWSGGSSWGYVNTLDASRSFDKYNITGWLTLSTRCPISNGATLELISLD